MAPPNFEKLRLDELARLGLVLEKVNRKLAGAEGPEARPLSERLVQSLKKDLEDAIEAFESASFDYLNTLDEADETKAGLKTAHFEQIDKCDPALDKLYDLTKTMEAAKQDPSRPPQQNTAAAKFEVNLLVTSLQNRLAQLEALSRDDATRTSVPALKAALKEVADLETAISSSLSQASKVLSSSGLPQAENEALAAQINAAADVLPGAIIPLKLTFNQLLAQIAPPPPTSQAITAGSVNMGADIVAGITAGFRPLMERMESSPAPAPKSAADFGYAKTPVPTFDGNIRSFTKWKIQVQDHLEAWRKSTSEKSAILKLDSLTPSKCDVSNCASLKEAWDKLTAKFGSATNIARVLLEDFKAYSPKGRTDEAKLVDLRDTLEKLQADLITNKQVGRCEDFSIIDTAEAMIPGSFRRDYVREKGDLIEKKGSVFGALFTFLQEQGTLIEEHMPDKLDHSKDTKSEKHSEEKTAEERIKLLEAKIYGVELRESEEPDEERSNDDRLKMLEAKIYELEVKRNQGADSEEKKKKSEEKVGKCPVCSEFHYWRPKSDQTQELASDRLSGCPKFKSMSLKEREEVVLKGNACAKCLSWKHERSNCTATVGDCPESNCGRPHHSLLHGTQHHKIMALQKVMRLRRKRRPLQHATLPSNEGFLEMCHYVFEDVNIGTTFLFDGASTTCLITAKLARLLCLKGKRRWVSILRQGDKEPEASKRYHYTATITTNTGVKHKVQFVEVDHISDLGPLPLPDKLYELFPHLPAGALERPIHDVGILIGQNAAALLPIGGDGRDLVGNLRLLKIPFGKGFTVGGFHPEVKVQSISKESMYRRVSVSAFKRNLPDPTENEMSKRPKKSSPKKKYSAEPQAKPVDYKSSNSQHQVQHTLPKTNSKRNRGLGGGSHPAYFPPYNTVLNSLKPRQPPTTARPSKKLRLSQEATSPKKSVPPLTSKQLWRSPEAEPHPVFLPMIQQDIGANVAVAHKPKLDKASYNVGKDKDGLVRTAHLEARPPSGKPYTSKQLQKFSMAVQHLVLLHHVEQEIYTEDQIGDFTEKAAADPDEP